MSDDFWIGQVRKLEKELEQTRSERDEALAKVAEFEKARFAVQTCGRCLHWAGSHSSDGKCQEAGCDCPAGVGTRVL